MKEETQSWIVTADGQDYSILLKRNGLKHELYINDIKQPLKQDMILNRICNRFLLGDKELYYILDWVKPRIAFDGYFLDNNEPYLLIKKVQSWVYAFIGLQIVIMFVLSYFVRIHSTYLPMLFVLFSSQTIAKISMMSASVKKRLIYSFVTVVTASLLTLLSVLLLF